MQTTLRRSAAPRPPHAAHLDHPAKLLSAEGVPQLPAKLAVPAHIHSQLDAAYAAGTKLGSSWNAADQRLLSAPRFVTAAIPPVPGADIQQRELAELHEIARNRTPEGIAAARYHAEYGSVGIWRRELALLREKVGYINALPAAIDVALALGLNGKLTLAAKSRFDRPRPFLTDPSLDVVVDRPHNDSYPSGHTSSAYAAATVLTHYMPERRDELLALAEQTAYSRSYGGVHYPTDLASGALVGAAMGQILIQERLNRAKLAA